MSTTRGRPSTRARSTFAIASGLYSIDRIAGTLGDVITGRGGRRSDDEITVFDSTGLAVQDLAIAGVALAAGKPGVALEFP